MLSVNHNAYKFVDELCKKAEEYGVTVSKMKSGATLIDAGLQATGGFLVGKIITEICMGGLGKA
ncbi:MAG: methenyltetrahydromethanopterin cyclohydrolase, partial [Candidatus Bathyarchaeia archaeon]